MKTRVLVALLAWCACPDGLWTIQAGQTSALLFVSTSPVQVDGSPLVFADVAILAGAEGFTQPAQAALGWMEYNPTSGTGRVVGYGLGQLLTFDLATGKAGTATVSVRWGRCR